MFDATMSRLDELKRLKFTWQGRSQRVSKALEALKKAVRPVNLDAETIRHIAEDPLE